MKKLIAIALLLCSTAVWAQETTAGIRILSESKELGREEALLKQALDDIYYGKMNGLKEKIVAIVKKESKSLTNETRYEEDATLRLGTSITLEENAGKTFINYHIPNNYFNFKVTTPSIAFGIGTSRINDPYIGINYSVKAVFEVIQSGTLESIKVLNPKCSIVDVRVFVLQSENLKAGMDRVRSWADYTVQYVLAPIYMEFNEMGNKLNDYFTATVKNNPQLLKELELDENRQLTVRADVGNNNLLFIHQHSKAGMVKRSLSTRPANVNQPVKAVPAATNTSAGSILKPARVTTIKQKPKVN